MTILKHQGGQKVQVKWSGILRLPSVERARLLKNPRRFIDGWYFQAVPGGIALLPKKNLVVTVGVARSADRLFSIANGTNPAPVSSLTQAVARIGVDNGTDNPASDSLSSQNGNGGTDGGSSTQTLRTFDSAATRDGLVVTASATFNDPTTGGAGGVSFAQKRLFLSAHSADVADTASADADGTLYSMTAPFTIDLTSQDTWSIVYAAQVTFAGS